MTGLLQIALAMELMQMVIVKARVMATVEASDIDAATARAASTARALRVHLRPTNRSQRENDVCLTSRHQWKEPIAWFIQWTSRVYTMDKQTSKSVIHQSTVAMQLSVAVQCMQQQPHIYSSTVSI